MTPALNRDWLPQPRAIKPRFSVWLDLLRWVAAFSVCLLHVRSAVLVDYSPAISPAWLALPVYLVTGLGHQTVIIFFVLSGYLIGGEVLRLVQQGNFDWQTYAVRRFTRLYAVYLFALLAGGLWDIIGIWSLGGDSIYYPTEAASLMLANPVVDNLHPDIFAWNLIFCQTLLAPTFGSNLPLWSLANEAWYYALFPLLLWPVFTPARSGARSVCLVLFVLGAWFVRGHILALFGCWLLGLAPHFMRRSIIRSHWIALAGMLVLLGLIRSRIPLFFSDLSLDLFLAALFALWLNALEHQNITAPGPAGLHRFLAGFSYSLYLTHWPFVLFITALLQHHLGIGYRMPFSPAALGVMTGLLLIVYAYSWCVAQLTERHTPALRRWLQAQLAAFGHQK